MNDKLIERCTLFFDDRASMDKAFRLSDCFTVSACAARLASKDIAVEPQRLKELHLLYKREVPALSYLRDVKPIAVALMAASEDPDAVLGKIKAAYRTLRRSFAASDHTALAAIMLTVYCEESEFDSAVSAVRAQYDSFKAKHRFRTDHSNIPACTLLTLKKADPAAAAEEAEECFRLMRSKHKFRCRWTLAQMLTLDPRGAEFKCADVAELRKRLKSERRSLSFYYELASVACLSEELKGSEADALAVFDTLSADRRFNGWRLDNEERLMVSYMLASPSPELFFLAMSGHFEKRAAQAAAAAA